MHSSICNFRVAWEFIHPSTPTPTPPQTPPITLTDVPVLREEYVHAHESSLSSYGVFLACKRFRVDFMLCDQYDLVQPDSTYYGYVVLNH